MVFVKFDFGYQVILPSTSPNTVSINDTMFRETTAEIAFLISSNPDPYCNKLLSHLSHGTVENIYINPPIVSVQRPEGIKIEDEEWMSLFKASLSNPITSEKLFEYNTYYTTMVRLLFICDSQEVCLATTTDMASRILKNPSNAREVISQMLGCSVSVPVISKSPIGIRLNDSVVTKIFSKYPPSAPHKGKNLLSLNPSELAGRQLVF